MKQRELDAQLPPLIANLQPDKRLSGLQTRYGKQVYSNRVGRRCGDGGLANLGNAR